MAQLIFHVENQYIHRLDEFHVVARSNHYLYAEFTFTDDWVGEKTAIFTVEADNGQTVTKPILIGADGTCEVPNEVLQYDDSQLEVSAFCGNRVTANKAIVIVHASGYNDDSVPDDPTPDVYTQIINRLANVEQIVIDKATEAESWATGGTDTREGEDTDNAKYYAEQTSQSATNAAQSATSASESATSASGSASAASASAGIASEKATEATTAKSSIDIAVDEIRGMETNARTYSQNAANSAEEAAETISVVRGYSETASQSARSASSSASDALESARQASAFVTRASGFATNAQSYAADANRSAQNASQSASDAADFMVQIKHTIAPIEDGDTASQAYAVGRYFYRNGDFCKAKTAIASGATFTLGTNYEVTTVSAELYTALH